MEQKATAPASATSSTTTKDANVTTTPDTKGQITGEKSKVHEATAPASATSSTTTKDANVTTTPDTKGPVAKEAPDSAIDERLVQAINGLIKARLHYALSIGCVDDLNNDARDAKIESFSAAVESEILSVIDETCDERMSTECLMKKIINEKLEVITNEKKVRYPLVPP
jgi:hypothetical protein